MHVRTDIQCSLTKPPRQPSDLKRVIQMVISCWPKEPETSHAHVSSRLLTGKELDPDFVEFNSVSRRYEFLYRLYLPSRAAFAQRDILLLALKAEPEISFQYSYALHSPTVNVDPLGLQDGDMRSAGDIAKDRANYPLNVSVDCPGLGQGLKDSIAASAREAYERTLKASLPRGSQRHPNRFRRVTLRAFGNLTIECMDCCHEDCQEKGKCACGNRKPGSFCVIRLCIPAAFQSDFGAKCGQLWETIMHEVSHCAGAPDERSAMSLEGTMLAEEIVQWHKAYSSPGK
jgi:hypothetical protein